MRYREPFSLYPRKLKNGKIVCYYRTYDEHGQRTTGKTTGKTSKTLAKRYCDNLRMSGGLIPQSSPTLEEWAKTRHWWEWGECLYIKSRLARSETEKPAVSRRYTDDALRILQNRILPSHGWKLLASITSEDCEKLLFSWTEKGVSYKTANNWASVYRVMMSEATRIGKINKNPWDWVMSLTPSTKRRGILTIAEARLLLNPETADTVREGHHLYYCINLTAALTAMRHGEVLALCQENVFTDHLHVEHSWSMKYGQGNTKTKVVADIPIPIFLYREIVKYLSWSGYVFSFNTGLRPATGNRVTGWLYRAMGNIGIQEHERVERNFTFHSWRHFFNTYLRSRGVSDAKIKAVTRHKTQAMTELYTSFKIEDFKDVLRIQEEIFENE